MSQFHERLSVMAHCTITDTIGLKVLDGWYTVLDFSVRGVTIGSLTLTADLAESPVMHEEISALLKPMGFIEVELNVWERNKSLPF
jgi:hypothetical protein